MVRFGRKEEKEGEKIKEQREQQGLGKGGEEGGWGGWGGRTIIRSVAGERRGKSAVQFRGRQWPSLLFFFFLCQGRTDGTVFGLSFSLPPPFFFSRQSSPPDFPMIRKCCCHWLCRGGKRGGRGFARPTSVSRLQVKKSRGTESGSEVCLLFHLATGEDSPPLPPLQGPAGEIPGRRTTGHLDSSVLSILCLTSSSLATVLLCPRFCSRLIAESFSSHAPEKRNTEKMDKEGKQTTNPKPSTITVEKLSSLFVQYRMYQDSPSVFLQ